MEDIHLSVVAGSRNDDHGGKLLYRMQHFVSNFIEQCRKYHLRAELILIDWNPPEENKPLSQVLSFPKSNNDLCRVRIITVPKEIHSTLNHSDQLPMFQMIAKNVGIRRAKGRYILATNVDILFSDALIEYLRDELCPGVLYRVDRLDVPSELPESGHVLDFCEKNYFRINGRYGTQILKEGKWVFLDTTASRHSQKFCRLKNHFWTFWLRKMLLMLYTGDEAFGLRHFIRRLQFRLTMNVHTNACGDFTLLSSEAWHALRGYPELEGFSWHLDAFLVYQSIIAGIKKKELPMEKCIYHIEHGKGSGYSPENHDLVFEKIKKKGIPYLNDYKLLKMVACMHKKSKKRDSFAYNRENWGFGNYKFQEISL